MRAQTNVVQGIRDVDISADETYAVVANWYGDDIARVDLATGEVTHPQTNLEGIESIRFARNPSGAFFAVASGGGARDGWVTLLKMKDSAGGSGGGGGNGGGGGGGAAAAGSTGPRGVVDGGAGAHLPPPAVIEGVVDARGEGLLGPVDVALAPSGSFALVAENEGGCVSRVDLSTGRRSVLVRGLSEPTGVAISRDGKFGLVVERAKDRVVRFTIKDGRQMATYPVSRPYGVFMRGSNTVALVGTSNGKIMQLGLDRRNQSNDIVCVRASLYACVDLLNPPPVSYTHLTLPTIYSV